ncbi:unnamed protein product [Leuciscus chuanchicus]
MGKKRVNRNLRASWNLDSLMSCESLDQNMDVSVPESGEASLRSQHKFEKDFNACATPSKSPPGKKKKADNVSLTEIFDAIQSLNSKQDMVFQKITHIESSIEITTAAVNSLSDTVKSTSFRCCHSRRKDRVVPRIKDKLEEAVDVVHRVGKQRPDGSPRHIIRFATRRYRDIIWMEAKNSIYLRENTLYVKESLSKADIKSQNKLWPLVLAAWKEGKAAVPLLLSITRESLPIQHSIRKLTTSF